MTGHPKSVDALLKIDEDTLLTGSIDGILRLVQIHPNKLIGVLGDHDGFPVEDLQFSFDKQLIGSISHDNLIRLWDASILKDEDSDIDEEVDCSRNLSWTPTDVPKKEVGGSEEEWDDQPHLSEPSEDSDEDSLDSDEWKSSLSGSAKSSNKRFKTENERFFEDL
jgi:WD40 repeat protein